MTEFSVPLVDTPSDEEYTTNQTAPWTPSFSRVSFSAHCSPWLRSRLASLATAPRTSATGQRTSATGPPSSDTGQPTSVTGQQTSVTGQRTSVTGQQTSATAQPT